MISINDTVVPADSVVARKVGEDMVLLDLESGQYFGLDAVGSRFWQLLEKSEQPLSDIGEAIHAEYDAIQEDIDQDLVLLANSLAERNLIVKQ